MLKALVKLSGAVPVLVIVTSCTALVVPISWLANVNDLVDKLITGIPAGGGVGVGVGAAGVGVGVGELEIPDPESATVSGVAEALLGRLKTPERVPVAVGLKTTLAVQLAPGA
jgi:hypothetical protein